MFATARMGLMAKKGSGSAPVGPPAINGYETWIGSIDTTSHTIPLPSGVVSGETLLCAATFDGAITITPPTGWMVLSHYSYTTLFTSALFKKTADGEDTLTVETSENQRGTAITYRIENAELIEVSHREMTAVLTAFPIHAVRAGTGTPGLLNLIAISISGVGTADLHALTNYREVAAAALLTSGDGSFCADKFLSDLFLYPPSTIGSEWSWSLPASSTPCICNSIGIAINPSGGWGTAPVVVSATVSSHLSSINTTIHVPLAASQGDLLIACVSSQAYSSAGATSLSTGWTRISEVVAAATGTSLCVFTKTATGSDELIVTSGIARLKDAIVYCLRNVTGLLIEDRVTTAASIRSPAVSFAEPTDFLCLSVLAAAANRSARSTQLEEDGYTNFISTYAEGSHYPVHGVEQFISAGTYELPGYWTLDVSTACATVTIAAY